MFNPDTSEIAKPSELLASVRAYMNVLQTVENYGNNKNVCFCIFLEKDIVAGYDVNVVF